MRRFICQFFGQLFAVICFASPLSVMAAMQCAVDPLVQYTELGGDPNDNRIHIDADSSVANYQQAEFAGSVHLNQGEYHILAPNVLYQDSTSLAKATEGGIFASSTFVVEGKEGSYDLANERINFANADYLLVGDVQNAIGSAQNAQFDQKTRLDTFEDITWTTCARQSPDWHLQATNLTIDHNEDRGVARNVTFRIKDTPVFYLPYFSFPTTDARQTGFLVPSAATSESRGVELTIPYYWNIAPNQDATIALRPMIKRGLMLEGEYRYLGENQYATLSGSWIADDKKSELTNRWVGKLTHQYQLNNQWRTSVLYQDVSDIDFIDDFGSNLSLYKDWYLERYAKVIGDTDYGDFLFQVQDYERISPDVLKSAEPYSRLPQFLYSNAWQKDGFSYTLNSEAVRFYKDTNGAATRLDAELTGSYRWAKPYGYLQPTVSMRATHYEFDSDFNQTNLDHKSRILPTFSLDGQLIFERNINWGGQSWTQTIEPRLFYLYTPYDDQSDIPLFDTSSTSQSWNWLFARNRFSGRDRIADANQLTTAVTTRLYNNEDGQEKLRLSIGQIQYFDDRKVGLSGNITESRGSSVMIGEGFYQIDRHWDIYGLTFWDNDTHQNERDIIDLRYKLDNDRFVSLRHRYDRDSYNQFSLTGVWRINPQWRVFARQDFSQRFDQAFNSLLGVEYNDCCWAWRLVGKHYRDAPDDEETHNAVYLEFVLKGLGNMGNRSGALLSDEIQGFRPLLEEREF